MVPCEGTFCHSFRHSRKDSRNNLKRMKPTDRFQSSFRFVLLDLIRLSFGSPGSPYIGLLACQAPPKTAMHDASLRKKHRASQPKPSLGAPKNGASLLWNGESAFAAAPKKTCGAEVDRSTCAFHHQNPNFCRSWQWIAWCHVESKREVAVVSLTCFAAFPDCQFCSHWFTACAEPPGVYGSRACEGGPKPADNCCLPAVRYGSNHTL